MATVFNLRLKPILMRRGSILFRGMLGMGCFGILGSAGLAARAGVIIVRQGASSPLLGTYAGTIDNTIHARSPDLTQPPDIAALNLGDFYPETRGVLLRFDLSDAILDPLSNRITSASLVVHTSQTSATADQDMTVFCAALKPSNNLWTESNVTWRHQNAASLTPWASGTNGPAIPSTDYHDPATERLVLAAEMNSSGTPVSFSIPPQRIADWILTSTSNAGLFYWSTLADNGGAGLDDNFQVRSSEAAEMNERPALIIRYRSPFTRAVFDAQDLLINGGTGFTGYDNSNGAITWGEAYIMRAYLQMYRATGDTAYLTRFVTHADMVLAKRDDFVSGGPSDPGWSYGSRGYESAAVTSGHIIEGLVRFARIVNADPNLVSFAPKAALYTTRAIETMNWLNTQFLFTLPGNRAAYRIYPNGSTVPLDAPNADATAGAVLLDLYYATGNAAHLSLADQIANTQVVNAFFLTEHGRQAWSYGYDGVSDPEDFSHAAHVAPFLSRMARAGHVITPTQASSIVSTILQEGSLGAGNVTAGIEGSTSPEGRIGSDPFVWAWGLAGGTIELAQFDLRLLPIVEAVQLRHYGLQAWQLGWPLYGIANMVRYNQIPQELHLTLSVTANGMTYATASKVYGTMNGTHAVALVNQANAGDVKTATLTLGGTGDDWARQWHVSMQLDAAGAGSLIGGSVNGSAQLLDGLGNVKVIQGGSGPAGYTLTPGPRGRDVAITGTLASSQTLLINANETTLIPAERQWAPPDLDFSGEVDGADLSIFLDCKAGTDVAVTSLCLPADFDYDSDVDQSDFATFQRCYSGSLAPANPYCVD